MVERKWSALANSLNTSNLDQELKDSFESKASVALRLADMNDSQRKLATTWFFWNETALD